MDRKVQPETVWRGGRARNLPVRVLDKALLLFSKMRCAGLPGSLHGYGVARRIEQISGDLLTLNQGTLYPVLLKLEQEGSIASE